MELKSFTVQSRQGKNGKGPARQQRMKGLVPAIMYGGDQEPVGITLNRRNFEFLLQGHTGGHAVLQLDVEDNPSLSSPALLKAVQRHPVKETIMHADFQRIALDKRIHTSVSVEIVGQARGVIDGGVLEHQLREVEIECLAIDVPELLKVDVSGLKIADSIHVADMQVPEGVTLITDGTRTVVSVHAPRVAKTGEGAEGAAAEGGAASSAS